MAFSIALSATGTAAHTTTVTGADDPTKEINKDQWNGTAAHTVVVSGTGSVTGELPIANGGTGNTTGTATVNANLTGPVTSVGNATTISPGVVTEAMQVLADNTTNNASTTAHGYLKKLDNTATNFMNGAGNWAVPAGTATSLTGLTAATGAVTIASGNNTGIVWNWANTTNSTIAFQIGETTAATNGTGIVQVLFKLATLATSTQCPFLVSTRGATSFVIGSSGLVGIGPNAPVVTLDIRTTQVGTGINGTNVRIRNDGAGDASFFFTSSPFNNVWAMGVDNSDGESFKISRDGNNGDVGVNTAMTITATTHIWSYDGLESYRFSSGIFQPSKASADTVSYAMNYRKSRGTVASPTVITTGDDLLNINAAGYVGATNTYRNVANLRADSVGTISDATNGIGGEWFLGTQKQGVDTSPIDRLKLDQVGHVLTIAGTANTPTITAGGGTGPTIAGNDTNCTITVGTGGIAASVTVTFGSAYAVAPRCVANHQGAVLVLRCVSTTTTCVIDAATPFTASGLIDLIVSGGTA